MPKGGLFAVVGPPEEDEDDFADDALPALDDEEDMPEIGAGPFEAYAETVFNAEAPIEERTEALRQALLTLIEEQGG